MFTATCRGATTWRTKGFRATSTTTTTTTTTATATTTSSSSSSSSSSRLFNTQEGQRFLGPRVRHSHRHSLEGHLLHRRLSSTCTRLFRRSKHTRPSMPPSAYKWEYGKVYSYDPTSEEYNKHTSTVFMLHGLGDTGEGWSFAGQQLKIEGARWFFPTAPTRPISCNMGMSMPGWFDVKQLPLSVPSASASASANKQVSKAEMNERVDESDIKDSVKYLLDLVKSEIQDKGIPPEKIILGGFSQGGHIAARAALECDEPLAGCVVLSSWIGEVEGLEKKSKVKVPFFIGHGQIDPMVPVDFGERSHAYIKTLGNQVTFKTYPGVEHSCNMQELDDVKDFILSCLEDPIQVEDLGTMSAGKLKKWLVGKGVDITGCLEKQDLIEKAKETLKE